MSETQYILVCDDEMHIRAIIAQKLRAAGHTVVEAPDGQAGFDAASKSPPRLVITDFQMPFMSGLEMCKALKANASTASTPVLMLTARGYILSPEDLATTNIRSVIGKPFGVRQLLEKVESMLAGAASGQPGAESSTGRDRLAA